jgi:hypothetical protein
LELVVLENEPEREDVEELDDGPGQPIDIGELDALGEDMVVVEYISKLQV